MTNQKNNREELCFYCMNEPGGFCGIHSPRKLSKKDAINLGIAVACERLVQIGIAKRESPSTISINLGRGNII